MLPKDASAEKLDQWKEDWKAEAEQIVLKRFPEKVFEYDQLLKDGKFQLNRISDFRTDVNIPIPSACANETDNHVECKKRKLDLCDGEDVTGTKVLAFINGVSPSNRNLLELIHIVKPIVREIVENVNKLKMWLLLLIPRIEDGNNFGVAIQEETLSEVRAVESEAAAFLDQISRYFLTRGKLVSRIAKYPHVEDYREAVVDLDEKEFLNLRLVLTEVRNHYAVIHDMILKNYEKIKKPRSSNMEHLY